MIQPCSLVVKTEWLWVQISLASLCKESCYQSFGFLAELEQSFVFPTCCAAVASVVETSTTALRGTIYTRINECVYVSFPCCVKFSSQSTLETCYVACTGSFLSVCVCLCSTGGYGSYWKLKEDLGCLFLSVSITGSIYIYIYLYLSISIYIYLFLYLSISISMSIYIYLYLHLYLSVSISIYIYIYLYIYLYLSRRTLGCLCLSLSLSVSVSVTGCYGKLREVTGGSWLSLSVCVCLCGRLGEVRGGYGRLREVT